MKKLLATLLALCILMLSTVVLAEESQIVNKPGPFDKELYDLHMKKERGELDESTAFRVPILNTPHLLKDLLRNAVKNRINMETIIASQDDKSGAASSIQMLLASQDITISQEQLLKELNSYPEEVEAISIPKVINQHFIGKEVPDEDGAGYRRAIIMSADLLMTDYAKFYERIVRNIEDGYPTLCHVDLSRLYPGEEGEAYLLLSGFLQDENEAIIYFYLQDPLQNHQDERWQGLKYCEVTELVTAILDSSSQSYFY